MIYDDDIDSIGAEDTSTDDFVVDDIDDGNLKRDEAEKLISRQPVAVRSLIIVPIIYEKDNEKRLEERSTQSRLEEATGLANAIFLDVIACQSVNIAAIRPATLLGKGKIDEYAHYIKDNAIKLAIIDYALSPVQQRNLEKAWDCKVIDRTALILEIFGERARTKEGVLQVELAHLNYQKGRLVRSWTHLERQRGGGGFLGGPGETQIEADRRMLQDKIMRIKRELETVVKTRALHRAKRKKTPHPVIALVGYTNAGKSTLFNRLTGADVLAKDMLFATLDPTLRKIELPQGQTIILSDTVGFISNLPTHLIAAFRATLEEVIEADLILHVRDMSDPDHRAHARDVLDILASLNVDIDNPNLIVEVWNKVDLLDKATLKALQQNAKLSSKPALAVSALTGEGIEDLLSLLSKQISGTLKKIEVVLSAKRLSLLHWFYQNATNVTQIPCEDGSIQVTATLSEESLNRLNQRMKEIK